MNADMFGSTKKAAPITTAVMQYDKITTGRSSSASSDAPVTARRDARWPRIDGSKKTAPPASTNPIPATEKNGVRQPPRSASHKPAGTPRICANDVAPMTAPNARPRRAAGITSATIDIEMEVAGPPNSPANMRAAISDGRPTAKPPAAVPSTKPTMATASAERRSKRSKKNDPTMPAIAAAAV